MTATQTKKSFVSGLSTEQFELLIAFRKAATETERLRVLAHEGIILLDHDERMQNQLVKMGDLAMPMALDGIHLAFVEYSAGAPIGIKGLTTGLDINQIPRSTYEKLKAATSPESRRDFTLENLVFYRPNNTGHDAIEFVLPAPR